MNQADDNGHKSMLPLRVGLCGFCYGGRWGNGVLPKREGETTERAIFSKRESPQDSGGSLVQLKLFRRCLCVPLSHPLSLSFSLSHQTRRNTHIMQRVYTSKGIQEPTLPNTTGSDNEGTRPDTAQPARFTSIVANLTQRSQTRPDFSARLRHQVQVPA